VKAGVNKEGQEEEMKNNEIVKINKREKGQSVKS
jgi:hypothetical protein